MSEAGERASCGGRATCRYPRTHPRASPRGSPIHIAACTAQSCGRRVGSSRRRAHVAAARSRGCSNSFRRAAHTLRSPGLCWAAAAMVEATMPTMTEGIAAPQVPGTGTGGRAGRGTVATWAVVEAAGATRQARAMARTVEERRGQASRRAAPRPSGAQRAARRQACRIGVLVLAVGRCEPPEGRAAVPWCAFTEVCDQ